MSTRRQLKKIFRKSNGPDYTDRFPALAYFKEREKKKKASIRKKAAICTCIVIALITTVVTITLYSSKDVNDPSQEMSDNSNSNSIEIRESTDINNSEEC